MQGLPPAKTMGMRRRKELKDLSGEVGERSLMMVEAQGEELLFIIGEESRGGRNLCQKRRRPETWSGCRNPGKKRLSILTTVGIGPDGVKGGGGQGNYEGRT